MENPFDDDISAFAVIFTRAVIAWNNVERSGQSILQGLSEGGIGAMAAITHLKPVRFADALLAVADSYAQSEREDNVEASHHIAHFVAGMDILRAYRNHYVHNLLAVGMKPGDPETFQGLLHVWEAKKKISYVQEDLSTEKLAVFMQHVLRLNNYGDELNRHFSRKASLALLWKPKQPLASLEKPPWPSQLTKTRHYLTTPPHRPEASRR